MGQILHGSGRTTEAVRRAIQHSQESLRVLAKRYGINQKTVAKWKRRTAVKDLPTGPKDARSTTLSVEEEAIMVTIDTQTRFPTSKPRVLRGSLGSIGQSLVISLLSSHNVIHLELALGKLFPRICRASVLIFHSDWNAIFAYHVNH